RFAQRWNVLEENLLLQVFRAGGNEDTLAAEDGRHEVGERLSGAGPRLGEQHAAVLEGARDSRCHRALSVAGFEVGNVPRQWTTGSEDALDGGNKTAGCQPSMSGYRGNFWQNASTSLRIAPSARSSSGVFRARTTNSAMVSISASRIP